MAENQIPQYFVNLLVLAMIISGASNTLVYNLQNNTKVSYDGQVNIPFMHPFMQAVTMFIGEGFCFLLYLWYKRIDTFRSEQLQAQAKGLKINVNYFWLLVPAMADLLTSTLQYIALNYLAPSIYQMLRGGVIVVTAFFSVIFLKNKLDKSQYVGCGLAIIGIIIVGLSAVLYPRKQSTNSSSTTQTVVAMFLIIISLITNGILFVSEEKLFKIYFMHPFQVVGGEGLWGLLGYLLLLPILTFVQCPASLSSKCVEKDNKYFFERPDAYFYEITHNGLLMFLVITGIFTIALFNISGVSVTKYVSALARSIVDVTRTVIVWVVGLIVTFTVPDSNWESTQWQAILIQLCGFMVLVLGNLIYNKIVKIQCLESVKIDDPDLLVSMKESEETQRLN